MISSCSSACLTTGTNPVNFTSPYRRDVTTMRNALTLLELLVVLVILAVVATVAVNSLQPRVESARFEQTQKLIGNIQESILGPRSARLSDGTPLVSGFVADIGRPPMVQGSLRLDADPVKGTELSELWDAQTQLAQSFPFQFRSGPSSPVNFSDVLIPCGWRGPYLQLPMGNASLSDSWGRPFEIRAGLDQIVESVVWQPTASYDQPIEGDVTGGKVSVTGAVNFGQADPASFDVVMLVPAPETSRTELVVLADEDDNAATFTFSRVPIGLRAICITADNQRILTKYVNVPHQGLSLVFDLTQIIPQNPTSDTDE